MGSDSRTSRVPHPLRRSAWMIAVFVVSLCPTRPAAALNYGWYHWTALLENPGAEDGVFDPWTQTIWSLTPGSAYTQNSYPILFGVTSGPTTQGGKSINGTGSSWFRGGEHFDVAEWEVGKVFTATTNLTQTVDVSFLTGAINANGGAVAYGGDAFELCLGTFAAAGPPSAVYKVESLDSSGAVIPGGSDSLTIQFTSVGPEYVAGSRKTKALPHGVSSIRFTATASAPFHGTSVSNPALGEWRMGFDELHFDLAVFMAIGGPPIPLDSHGNPGVLGAAPIIPAPTCAEWTAAGSLTTDARCGAASTLNEATGEMLVMAGQSPCAGDLSSVEIYNPGSGTWRVGPSVAPARAFATATYLTTGPGTGKVLLIGGTRHTGGACCALLNADLYDAGALHGGMAGTVARPRLARYGHTATRLLDGRVLVAGGHGGADLPSARQPYDAEVYSPALNSWEYRPDFLASVGSPALIHHTATLLQDGRILFLNTASGAAADVIIYDPAGMSAVRNRNAYPGWRSPIAARLADGKVLVAGLAGCQPAQSLAMRYDPVADFWERAPSMHEKRAFATATTLPSGWILVVGGCTDGCPDALSSAEIFRPTPYPAPKLDAGPDETVALTLGFLVLVGKPEGGTWTGAGVSGSTFRPAVAGIGPHTLTYTFACPYAAPGSDTKTVTVAGP